MKIANLKSRLENAARDGDKVVFDGKTLWAGLGNRSGLHSFASTLCREKWDKSGAHFLKRLGKLGAGTIEVKQFSNINRDRGRWVTVFKAEVTIDEPSLPMCYLCGSDKPTVLRDNEPSCADCGAK